MPKTEIETTAKPKSTSDRVKNVGTSAIQAAVPALVTVAVSFFAERALNQIFSKKTDKTETE